MWSWSMAVKYYSRGFLFFFGFRGKKHYLIIFIVEWGPLFGPKLYSTRALSHQWTHINMFTLMFLNQYSHSGICVNYVLAHIKVTGSHIKHTNYSSHKNDTKSFY
jgi:hypothetical protein